VREIEYQRPEKREQMMGVQAFAALPMESVYSDPAREAGEIRVKKREEEGDEEWVKVDREETMQEKVVRIEVEFAKLMVRPSSPSWRYKTDCMYSPGLEGLVDPTRPGSYDDPHDRRQGEDAPHRRCLLSLSPYAHARTIPQYDKLHHSLVSHEISFQIHLLPPQDQILRLPRCGLRLGRGLRITSAVDSSITFEEQVSDLDPQESRKGSGGSSRLQSACAGGGCDVVGCESEECQVCGS
jgi:hypothetical protein